MTSLQEEKKWMKGAQYSWQDPGPGAPSNEVLLQSVAIPSKELVHCACTLYLPLHLFLRIPQDKKIPTPSSTPLSLGTTLDPWVNKGASRPAHGSMVPFRTVTPYPSSPLHGQRSSVFLARPRSRGFIHMWKPPVLSPHHGLVDLSN